MMLKAKQASNAELNKQLSPLKAPPIQEKLKVEQARLLKLQQRHKIAALASLTNGESSNDLADVKSEIQFCNANIETLTAAHAAAVEVDEVFKRREYAELHRREVNSVRQHLLARDRAAAELSKHLTDADKAFRVLLEQSQKARQSIVMGAFPNSEIYVEFTKLKALVEMEMFRIGGDGTIGNPHNFPGARCHDHKYLNQPDAAPPMLETLANASANLLNVLTGKEGIT